jgi:cysteine synthase A
MESLLDNSNGKFWAKLESRNPGGMKGRAALGMVRAAMSRGELAAGGHIVESTSGTLGLALAFLGSTLGLRVTLVVDPGMEPMMHNLLRAYGAELIVVDAPHPEGGWQEARRSKVAEILWSDPWAFWPNQYNNPDNPSGYQSLSEELLEQLGHIDVLVCSVGTGGHSSGISRHLRTRLPKLRLIGVDSINSTIFGQENGPRAMRGLGSSIYPDNVSYADFNEVHWVSPEESVKACRLLARRHGITGGWSTGAVSLVASWYADSTDGTICTIFPDGPERYWETIYDDQYCSANNLLLDALPQQPRYVPEPMHTTVKHWSYANSVYVPRKS